ncbi:hypothetical protein [Winogradskyella sediminis]|uniref:hypothetical protein n=1 Tax=Winogradskyella sediminis TaxID=1382466 RepID=UPI000E24229E|nr:hypothetical protein [Winogradskyella sediminis]REG88219.1 hypothetical protein C8N41_1021079 [Winogradskyella sediminis]
MKNIYWILILISFQSYSQNEQWFDFELDSLIRFKLPAENASLFDSEQDGIKMYELSAEKNGIVYSGNKILISDSSLPNSIADLKSIYDEAMPNVSKNYPNTVVKKQDIENNGFKGQKVTLTDSNGNRLYESEVYLLNNNLFLFNCISKNESDIKDSNFFFNQISLPKNSEIKQLIGKSDFQKTISNFKTELLILIGIIGLIIGIILIKKNYLQHRV